MSSPHCRILKALFTYTLQQKIKARVRLAKFALRGVNFSCSLIIISMMSSTFAVFNATRSLPTQSGMPSWNTTTNSWPQKLVLSMACVSLAACILVFAAYFRGGHKRAEKVSTYYTLFAIGWVSSFAPAPPLKDLVLTVK
jgi:hypothetical protein